MYGARWFRGRARRDHTYVEIFRAAKIYDAFNRISERAGKQVLFSTEAIANQVEMHLIWWGHRRRFGLREEALSEAFGTVAAVRLLDDLEDDFAHGLILPARRRIQLDHPKSA